MIFALCTDVDPELDEYAAAIHAIGKRSAFEIGKILSAAKARARPGRWLPWLEREFGWTARTAQRMMSVAEKNDKLSHLAVPTSGALSARRSKHASRSDRGHRRAQRTGRAPVAAEVKK